MAELAWSPQGRDFEPDVPVHTWTRFMYGYDLLVHPALKKLAIAIILQAANKAKVQIRSLAVLDNHVHPFVVQGLVTEENATREGIFPFSRNWKREVSRRLNLLDIKGCKYEGPYESTVLHTDGEYLGACGYVMDQAVRHGLNVDSVWVSDAVLRGEADGVLFAVPDMGLDPDASDEERVAWFAELVERTMEEAVQMIAQHKLGERSGDGPPTEGPRPVSPERRAARERLEARRARRAVLDRVDRRELTAWYWYEAGTAVLDAVPGLSGLGASSDRRMIELADVYESWGELAKRLGSYELPKDLQVSDRRRESDQRVRETVITAGKVERRVVWARRVPQAEPPP